MARFLPDLQASGSFATTPRPTLAPAQAASHDACPATAEKASPAAGWLSHLSGGQIDVRSAGSVPAKQINPMAVQAMREVGIDITA